MSHSLDDIELAIVGFSYDEEDAWRNFRNALLNSEYVPTALGHAYYGDKQDGEANSYGYFDNEQIWLIFKLGDRYFRKSGFQSSYDSYVYDGALVEVEPEAVQKTIWKVK